jgi:hypothetical protein
MSGFCSLSQFLTCRQTGNSKPLQVSQYRSDRAVHSLPRVPKSLLLGK